jgi:hypothetical protein
MMLGVLVDAPRDGREKDFVRRIMDSVTVDPVMNTAR